MSDTGEVVGDGTEPAAGQDVNPPVESVESVESGSSVPLRDDSIGLAGEELRAIKLVPDEKAWPTSGWRKWLRLATFGSVALGPSADARRADELKAAVDVGLHGIHSVLVLGGKGGSGKTTTTIGVGSTFALLHHKVVAIDANPDVGANLGDRMDPSAASSYRELLADDAIERYADVRLHLGNDPTSGLDVLPADRRVSDRKLLDAKTYLAAHQRLQRFYSVLVTDSGTNIEHPVAKGLLESADAIVVVASCTPDSAQAAGKVMDWLAGSRHSDLLTRAVVVLNDVTGRADQTMVQTVVDVFSRRVGAGRVFLLPHDPHLANASSVDISRLRPATRRRFLEITAATTTLGPIGDRSGQPGPGASRRRTPRLALALVTGLTAVAGGIWLARADTNPSAGSGASTVAQRANAVDVAAWTRANVPVGTPMIVDDAVPPVGYPGVSLTAVGQNWRGYRYFVTTHTGADAPSDAARAAVWMSSAAVAVFDTVQIRRILAQTPPEQIQRNRDVDRVERMRVAQAMHSNPRLTSSPGARQILDRGELDQRAGLVVAALADQQPLTLTEIGVDAAEAAAGLPARSVTIATSDPAPATTSLRAVLAPLTPDRIDIDQNGYLRLHWPLDLTPVPSVG